MGKADGNLVQVSPEFAVKDTHGLELLHLEGRAFSLRKEFTLFGSTDESLEQQRENYQIGRGRILG